MLFVRLMAWAHGLFRHRRSTAAVGNLDVGSDSTLKGKNALKSAVNPPALGAVILALAGRAQSSLLKPVAGNGASAPVESPLIGGEVALQLGRR